MESFGREIECLQSPSGPVAYDAFRCQFPGCNATYQRREHLSRHERSKHIKKQAIICSRCGHNVQFSDTLRRHIQRQHHINEPLNRARQACAGCHAVKTRCEGGAPCRECVRRNIKCSFQNSTSIAAEQQIRSSTQTPSPLESDQARLSHWEKRKQYIDCYFEIFHPRWPFMHRGTFNLGQEPPLLLQSMIAIGMWITGEQSAQSAAVELSGKLDFSIRDQTEKWNASEVEGVSSACPWPMATYQAILLHLILSVIMKANSVINLDLRASISPADLGLLKSLVESCRRLGMFFYPNMLSKYKDTDLPSFVWVGVEEVKRFSIALYRFCAKVRSFSSEDRPLLHASELRFPLPSNDALWNSAGRHEWEANAKEENSVSFNDDLQARWISKYTDIIDVLDF
ncbi:C2H2 type zinc finger domain protein [Penicillium macrosclerotiorum]|uniref:C2H2 type zinc finger domain protein n=1 Tax=Penicillium macrosclerotiorum TaxID=303699 RepID=UPI002548839C|nr:C2H2 type zinc finger domain protein [Penicillium macrosclerotiorum]KAJ5673965.1 C2H2 type zinc finger domain protein [Penicillium macrosclerotiorum]